jgi:ABC-2 type transport system ATP-binding protein
LGAPPILLLDEPGAGLDPAQLRNLRMTLAGLSADHAILLSTHHIADIVETCTRVIALARGRVVLDQPRAALGADPERAVVRVLVDEPGLAANAPGARA